MWQILEYFKRFYNASFAWIILKQCSEINAHFSQFSEANLREIYWGFIFSAKLSLEFSIIFTREILLLMHPFFKASTVVLHGWCKIYWKPNDNLGNYDFSIFLMRTLLKTKISRAISGSAVKSEAVVREKKNLFTFEIWPKCAFIYEHYFKGNIFDSILNYLRYNINFILISIIENKEINKKE